jgi:hypothetical protein
MPGSHSCDVLVEQRVDQDGNVIYGTEAELIELVNATVWPTLFETPAFVAFTEKYLWDDVSQNRVLDQYARQFPNWPVTCRNMEQIVTDLLLIGDPTLNSAIVPEEVAPEPPQLKKARELKQLREEIESDLGEGGFGGISTRAIEAKCQTRSDYRKMFNEMRRPEFTRDDLPEFTQELNDFATAYNTASASSLKMQGGVYRVGGVPYGADKFNQLLQDASALKLIRG